MESLKTDVLSNLASAEELADTDLIPVGTGSGNALKKLTVANMITWLKEKLGLNGYITTSSFSLPFTLKNGVATVSHDIAKSHPNHTPLGIVRCSFSSSYLTLTGYNITNDNMNLTIRDVATPTTSSATGKVYFTVIYVKK